WRGEVDAFFRTVDPLLEAQLYPPDAPRRLVVQIYGRDIAVQREKLWSRFTGVGVRVPLDLEGTRGTDAFLGALLGAAERGGSTPALFAGAGTPEPLDAWIVEAHDALHALCAAAPLTGLSYDRVRGYRDELNRALNRKIQSGVESPQAFAAYARSLQIVPA